MAEIGNHFGHPSTLPDFPLRVVNKWLTTTEEHYFARPTAGAIPRLFI